jgi:hypothetical protein
MKGGPNLNNGNNGINDVGRILYFKKRFNSQLISFLNFLLQLWAIVATRLHWETQHDGFSSSHDGKSTLAMSSAAAQTGQQIDEVVSASQ